MLLVSLFLSASSFAATPIYIADGKQTGASGALMASVAGKTVFKCQEVIATPNEKGTSITLKAKKAGE